MATSDALKLGYTVLTMGFPLSDLLGTAPRLTKGMISAVVGIDNDTNQWQVSAEVQPGNSGGPLLTEDGHVAGVVSGTLNPMKVLVRTGGSLPQNVNFAIKSLAVHEFLQRTGVTANNAEDVSRSLDSVQESVALVRAGIIPPGQESLPELMCAVSYWSIWDMFFRFRVLRIKFYDLKSGELLLQAGQERDNPFAGEDGTLDATFEQIRPHFQAARQ